MDGLKYGGCRVSRISQSEEARWWTCRAVPRARRCLKMPALDVYACTTDTMMALGGVARSGWAGKNACCLDALSLWHSCPRTILNEAGQQQCGSNTFGSNRWEGVYEVHRTGWYVRNLQVFSSVYRVTLLCHVQIDHCRAELSLHRPAPCAAFCGSIMRGA